jgi:hypothetical protein
MKSPSHEADTAEINSVTTPDLQTHSVWKHITLGLGDTSMHGSLILALLNKRLR